jgi:hypothetical protein
MNSSLKSLALCRLGSALAVTGFLFASLPAHAVVSQVSTRAALGGTDTLSWGQLGPDSTDPLTVPISSVTTALALTANVSNSTGDLFRFDEGGANSGYAGSFSVGDELLSTFLSAGPLVINFASPVARVGAQIQSLDTAPPLSPGLAFTGWMEAFDTLNVSLGSFSVLGSSDMLQNNTAPFLGIVSTAANISSVHFHVSGTPNLDFSINTVSLSVTPVPEPSAWLAALMGAVFLSGLAYRRREQAGS